MPTVYPDLVPKPVAADVITAVRDRESALMQLARTIPMPSGVEVVPVVTSAPASGFVSPVYGGLKPGSAIDFAPTTLTAGEIGVVLGVPDAWIADVGFPVWESIRDEIIKSFVRVFELAALYGTNAPPEWPTGGLTAAAQADAVTGADALAALDAAMSNLEAKGVTPTGILGGGALRAALRAQMVTVLQPFSEAPPSIYGVPIRFSSNWNDATGLALVGGFDSGVLVGVREDITWAISSEGVISDGSGNVVLNALQSDSSILRSYWRLALQAVKPIGPAGTPVKPLALAKVGVARSRSLS